MASREEFQAYMKATANEIEGSKRPCPGTEELIAYYRSLGNDSTREAIASHLSLCGNCRQTLVDLRDFFDPAPDDSAGAPDLDREKVAKLGEALRQLPSQMRRCLHLRLAEECSYEDIAVTMGISIGTVKSHIHRAREKLREELRPYFGDAAI